MAEYLSSSNFWLGIGAGSVAIGFVFFLILYYLGGAAPSDMIKHRPIVFKIRKSLNPQEFDKKHNQSQSAAVRSFGVLGFFIMVIGACAMTYGGYLFFWGR